jgi:hypothetical protein
MNPETEISDLLSCLLPSTRMRIWLNKVFEAKAAKGEPFPERDVLWLAFVERACSDLPSEKARYLPIDPRGYKRTFNRR